jgi:hypothetical protein
VSPPAPFLQLGSQMKTAYSSCLHKVGRGLLAGKEVSESNEVLALRSWEELREVRTKVSPLPKASGRPSRIIGTWWHSYSLAGTKVDPSDKMHGGSAPCRDLYRMAREFWGVAPDSWGWPGRSWQVLLGHLSELRGQARVHLEGNVGAQPPQETK